MGISQPVSIVGISVSNTYANIPTSYILDNYSINAAYSIRKLTNKNTPLFRVRRTSDNVEQDMYSMTEVIPFCTTATGCVTTWYDQGPNDRHATQTVANIQPYICSAGSLFTLSAYNALSFHSTAYLSANINIAALNTKFGALTTTYRFDNTNRTHFGGLTSAFKMRNGITGVDILRDNKANILNVSDTTIGLKIAMGCWDGSLTRLLVNTLSEATTATQVNSSGINVTRIGASGSAAPLEPFGSTMADCIFLNDSNAYPELHTAFRNLYGVV
jgi:hypothetical protein